MASTYQPSLLSPCKSNSVDKGLCDINTVSENNVEKSNMQDEMWGHLSVRYLKVLPVNKNKAVIWKSCCVCKTLKQQQEVAAAVVRQFKIKYLSLLTVERKSFLILGIFSWCQ